MLSSEAWPPTKRSTLRWTAVLRPRFLEPHVALQGSQGALPPRGLGFVQDGYSREAMVPHVLIQSLSMEKALGVATSAHEKEVEMLPHMAEGSVCILVNDPTIGTEGQLPSLALNV